jgi:hypothetical protein
VSPWDRLWLSASDGRPGVGNEGLQGIDDAAYQSLSAVFKEKMKVQIVI